MSPSTKESAPKDAPLATIAARQLDRQPTYYTKQRIARGRPSVAHDLRATWPGRCHRCGEQFDAGSVVTWSLAGIRHAVCPAEDRDPGQRYDSLGSP